MLNFKILVLAGVLCFSLLFDCLQSTTADSQEGAGIRLVGGPDNYEGRVEVWYNNSWAPICRENWDLSDAHIVCRQLGFEQASETILVDSYENVNSTLWLRDIDCAGSEATLQECNFFVSSAECSQEVGIVCESEISVRLVDGEDVYSGRLEILYRGQWGTVCSDSWDDMDAQVICGMLGAPGVQSAMTSYGPGIGPIWLDNVECDGDEESIADCKFPGWGKHDCSHQYDVGLSCRDVRLVGGSNILEGRVSIHHDGIWGSVCDNRWDLRDADVVCRQMGFKSAFKATGAAAFGEGTGPIFLDDVQCTGEESALRDCYHRGFEQHVCQHSQDAGVICDEVRLVGGSGDHEGRLEILHNGVWGSVCNDKWDFVDARVVCRQLGYEDALNADVGSSEYGQGTGPIWLDEVACNGDERRLVDCGRAGWDENDCDHSEDIAIVCVTGPTLRLERGSQTSGRVEVLYEGEWGTVCDSQWDIADAIVACQYLGFPGASWPTIGGNFGEGSGPVWMSGVQCTGMEQRLQDCSQSEEWGVNNCDHSMDAGAVCVQVIADIQPPEILDCPSDIFTTVESHGAPDVAVSWRQPIATDNSGEIPSVYISHSPGYLFPIGTTLVSYIFEDESQNQAVCTFVVNVEDLPPTTTQSTTTQLPTSTISLTSNLTQNISDVISTTLRSNTGSSGQPFSWDLIIYVVIPLSLSVLLVLLLACVVTCVCSSSKRKTPPSAKTESRKGLYLAADVPSTEFEMMSAYSASTSRNTMEGRQLPSQPHHYEVDPPEADINHQYDDTDSGHYEALPPLRDEHGYLILYDEPPQERAGYLVPDKRLSALSTATANPDDLVVYSARSLTPDTPPDSLLAFQNGGYESSLNRTTIEDKTRRPKDLRNVSPLALLAFQNGEYQATETPKTRTVAQTTQRQPEQKNSKDKGSPKHEKLRRMSTAP